MAGWRGHFAEPTRTSLPWQGGAFGNLQSDDASASPRAAGQPGQVPVGHRKGREEKP
jgi:hypothetical protein